MLDIMGRRARRQDRVLGPSAVSTPNVARNTALVHTLGWHNAIPVTATTDKKRAPFPIAFYRSAVGKKWVMAITGLAIILFVLAHMVGNWKVFLPEIGGVPEIDFYA